MYIQDRFHVLVHGQRTEIRDKGIKQPMEGRPNDGKHACLGTVPVIGVVGDHFYISSRQQFSGCPFRHLFGLVCDREQREIEGYEYIKLCQVRIIEA